MKDGSFMYKLFHGRGFLWLLVLISLLGLALRLGVSADLLTHDVQVDRPSGYTDMWTYKDLAERIMKGEYIGEFYYQPFYYAVFLPISHFLFGASSWAVILMQSLAGFGTVFFSGLSASLLFGRKAGALAALLVSLSAALILYTPYTLLELSQAFWITLLFFLTLKAMKYGGAARWGAVGLILSFSILTRGNSWIFAPGIFLACLWCEYRAGARRLASSLIVLGVLIVLPQLPFAMRNCYEKGTLCGPSTAAGAVLALGNTPEAPAGGRNPGYGPGPMEYPPTYHAWMQDAATRSVPGRIVEWIKSEPLAFAELTFRKALLFWDAREIPNNIAFEYNGVKSIVWRIVGVVPTGFILAFALAGLIVTLRLWPKRPGVLLLAYFIGAYWVATVAFYILARFRVPSLPLLCMMAGGFLAYDLRDILQRDRRKLLVDMGALFVGVFVCYFAYDLYRYHFESSVMKTVRPNGVRVELSAKEFMALDNGPETFGSWMSLKMAPGMSLKKTFALPSDKKFKAVKLVLYTVCEQPGGIILSVNGETKPFRIKEPGLAELEFELKEAPADGVFTIAVIRVDAEMAFLLDLQRNYGRSILQDKPLDGELVARAYFTK